MLDGKGSMRRGGNVQREKFASGGSGSEKPMGGNKRGAEGEEKVKGKPSEGGESTTTITHHGDGSHAVDHADGEHSEHESTGHMLMHMHAKHHPGEPAHHAHQHDEGVTTHHVGMDGMVEGPHQHGSADEAGEHMKQVLGEDGGNGAVQMSDGMEEHGAMPQLY
jgi:hypothetical protein